MNWIEIVAIKSFTDGSFCKKSASCVQYMTEWRKEGTSFFLSQNSLLLIIKLIKKKEQGETLVCIV